MDPPNENNEQKQKRTFELLVDLFDINGDGFLDRN